jgi:hypothetical protein
MPFTNIRILDLDINRTGESPTAPGLRLMFLCLSADPPIEWAQIFEQERVFPRHSMWRRAHVEGRYIVVDCVPEEIEKFHLRDLKEDVANTNQKYAAWLAQRNADEEREAQAKRAEHERLQKLKNGLNFD